MKLKMMILKSCVFLCLFSSLQSTESSTQPSKRIKLVILDNSGTTNDCGVYAPAVVFIEVFQKYGIDITMAEAREPMGLFKKDHIRAILQMPRVSNAFEALYARPWTESDVEEMFADYIPMQMDCLDRYSAMIPGVAETVAAAKESFDVIIGSTTGFNKEMNDRLLANAKQQGYFPDVYTSASEVPKARPYWYMVQENMRQAGIMDPEEVLKVGDTRGDMQEGKAMRAVSSSGTWTLGLSATGNYIGKTWNELTSTAGDQLQEEMRNAEKILYQAGADYVAPNTNSLPEIINLINLRLQKGDHPREISLDYLK